jgi:hypothetical protein
MYGGKYRAGITALVPDRRKTSQCNNRWKKASDPIINRASGRTGTWARAEDITLMNVVQTHGDKNWAAIAVLVPGRTISSCYNRWHYASDVRVAARTGTWAEDEDITLRNAVQTHGGKIWAVIAGMVPS